MNPETQLGTICSIGVLAHEFGHLFNLKHETNNSNLMSGSGILGSELNSNQLRVVKEYYKYNLK